jgi:hypothetical protein
MVIATTTMSARSIATADPVTGGFEFVGVNAAVIIGIQPLEHPGHPITARGHFIGLQQAIAIGVTAGNHRIHPVQTALILLGQQFLRRHSTVSIGIRLGEAAFHFGA